MHEEKKGYVTTVAATETERSRKLLIRARWSCFDGALLS